MMNPMYYIGLKNSGCASYWYIRDGSIAGDTSCVVIIDLITSLQNLLGPDYVDGWEDWETGHNVNVDPAGFLKWELAITGYSYSAK
jgi:hypothetical protein